MLRLAMLLGGALSQGIHGSTVEQQKCSRSHHHAGGTASNREGSEQLELLGTVVP